ncbi:unnamed protein product [Pleuronectes platessa]|uniref:Uncharacterized protein n=1 Tax=Pleuronectes platessa TaxID=8262 RepID=A0A9N7Z3H9_PLEPL|nr:unnamed protein product [Pleuronectes platessa]
MFLKTVSWENTSCAHHTEVKSLSPRWIRAASSPALRLSSTLCNQKYQLQDHRVALLLQSVSYMHPPSRLTLVSQTAPGVTRYFSSQLHQTSLKCSLYFYYYYYYYYDKRFF